MTIKFYKYKIIILFFFALGIFTTNIWGREYYTNRSISGYSEDAQGINYVLLHKIYTGTLLDESYVMGKISAIRGNTGAFNRKWTVEVNTSSAYKSNRGSILTYNEGASLVTLTYNNEKYLAVSISNSASLWDFSFTGYAQNEILQIVYDNNVLDVNEFTDLDPITVQGKLGIGVTNPTEKLDVNGNIQISNASIPMGLITELGGLAPLLNMSLNFRESTKNNSYLGAAFRIDARNTSDCPLFQWLCREGGTSTEKILMVLTNTGNIGIGTTTPQNKLDVNGTIHAREVKVDNNNWPDFVFSPTYNLRPLGDVESFIKANGHLPEVPKASDVKQNGVNLGEMQAKLLQKVEELTIYAIEQDKKIAEQERKNIELQQEIKELKELVLKKLK